MFKGNNRGKEFPSLRSLKLRNSEIFITRNLRNLLNGRFCTCAQYTTKIADRRRSEPKKVSRWKGVRGKTIGKKTTKKKSEQIEQKPNWETTVYSKEISKSTMKSNLLSLHYFSQDVREKFGRDVNTKNESIINQPPIYRYVEFHMKIF